MPKNVPAPASDDATTPADEERRIYIVVAMSAEFKTALEARAEEDSRPVSVIARRAIAEYIGYDLSAEPEPVRRSKHASEEDKLLAHRIASFKASQLRTLLVAQHKARIAGKTEKVAEADLALAALAMPDWSPDAVTMAKIRASVAAKLGAATEPEEADEEPEAE